MLRLKFFQTAIYMLGGIEFIHVIKKKQTPTKGKVCLKSEKIHLLAA